MAHLIIDDYGFGGQFFKCSHCGESWWDILTGVSSQDHCPECGEPINWDENEYITH